MPSGHVILCGMGHVGFRVVELLHRLGVPFTVIARDVRSEWRDEIEAKAVRFIEGDARLKRNLEEAGIHSALSLLAVTHNDLINIEIALDVQQLAPGLPIVVRIFDQYLADRMRRETGIRNVFSPALLTAPVFVAAALGDERLRVFSVGDEQLHLLRLVFKEDAECLGEPVEQFCRRMGLAPIAVHHANDEAATIRVGMELVAMADSVVERKLNDSGVLSGAPRLTHAQAQIQHLTTLMNKPLKPLTALRRIWRQTPPALRLPFFALASLLLSSVFVFKRFLPMTHQWVDAVYFMITIITTIGFGDISFIHAPIWLKIYGCFVMMSGVALVAVLYGIITDYIVTLRVEQALGRRPTVLEDHCIVVGLGDVGSRVAEELIRLGVPCVAIERDEDHAASPALQDKLQVIIADANRDSTLHKANVSKARAIIVTCTDDLMSLRIAHQAETINPALRSVVRIYDSSLAQKLSSGMGIDHTANPAQAAAATVVSGALRDGIEYGFLYQDRLLMMRWLTPFEVRSNNLLGRKFADLREDGKYLLLKRSNEDAEISALDAEDVVEQDIAYLALEEFDPTTNECVGPRAFEPAV